jgi:hypothetical protein
MGEIIAFPFHITMNPPKKNMGPTSRGHSIDPLLLKKLGAHRAHPLAMATLRIRRPGCAMLPSAASLDPGLPRLNGNGSPVCTARLPRVHDLAN